MRHGVVWPDGAKFAFTIVDDTDHATVTRVRPIYDLLFELGFRTTKTVWVFPTVPGAHYESAETLDDAPYRQFILELRDRGFEIGLHGVRGCDSRRSMIEAGLERFHEILGASPQVHINHAYNRDNLYWGRARFTAIRRALHLYRGHPGDSFGHDRASEFFWGDLARDHVRYVRGHIFRGINTLACDPFMPYVDSMYPMVRGWFSASDGANLARFVDLIAEDNQARLEREGGLCIVYTHFGTNGFVDGKGRVHAEFASLLRRLADRGGWFRPVSVILDHLAEGDGRSLTWPRRIRLLANKWSER